jgi:hypothetical protein
VALVMEARERTGTARVDVAAPPPEQARGAP